MEYMEHAYSSSVPCSSMLVKQIFIHYVHYYGDNHIVYCT